MLPPIPYGLAPVTAQQDPAKPIPPITPVAAAQKHAKGGSLGMEDEGASTAQERAREEQRRQHQAQREAQSLESKEAEELPNEEDEPREKGELSRKGLWVDIKV